MRAIRWAVLAGVLWVGVACGAENMIGRQSQNEGMVAVPSPGPVTIDGDLRDWDFSGRIWVFADTLVRDRYSVEAAAMWDRDYLYLAAKWRDPRPMNSLIDPAVNPDEGWKEDSWQMRVWTPDKTLWLTTWYFTPKRQSVLHIAVWRDRNDERKGQDVQLLVSPSDSVEVGQGAQLAYRADADGKGFVQELRVPWKLLLNDPATVAAGLTLRMGHECLWCDPTGKTWPVHRYADNLQPGKTSREFFWSARNDWGDLKLVAGGHVPLRQYVSDTGRVQGTLPIRATLPAGAARFTLVLETPDGQRVRTVAADADPRDYAVGGDPTKVEVQWDGLDDRGRLAAAGAYRVRGLTHAGLSADYDMTFYNPGTPPWQVRDGSGAWGADHSGPIAVAAGGDWTVVTFPVVEGGSGVIGLDPAGRKRWGDRRGVTRVCTDADYAYAFVANWYTKNTLVRYKLTNGSPAPFVLDGQARTFDLPLAEILGREPGDLAGLAVHGGRLALALNLDGRGEVVLLDAASARVVRRADLPGRAGETAFAPDGTLYVTVDGAPQRVDPNDPAQRQVVTLQKPPAQPVGLAVDRDGRLLMWDAGADQQIKAYDPRGGRMVYTCGRKGGRPIRGAFDEQALSHVSSLAVDARGQVWAVENWNFPRRVSVWGRDGKLVRDYLGNTGYAGANCYLHDSDPTLAYCGPLEFKIDHTTHQWKLARVLWVPDPAKGESFFLDTGGNAIPQRFTSRAAGRPHEYLFAHETGAEGTGNVLFMERGGRWQPVCGLCLVGHISGKLDHDGRVVEPPTGEWADLNAYDVALWNDRNRDGRVQRAECAIAKTREPGTDQRGGRPALELGNGWGGRLGEDLSLYTDGLCRYKPIAYTDDGAPIWSLESRQALAVHDRGDLVPIPGERKLLCLSWEGYAGPTKLTGIDLARQTVDWYYPNPYPGVHGSHRATMPKPGLLVGPLKICGVARLDGAAGSVFLMRGNLGQDFLMTSDGLFVGAMFQDGRLPGESLPDREQALRGAPLDAFSEGGEPFNGWFGRQSDGQVRLTTGWAREAGMILTINGLDSIRRCTAPEITVTQADLVRAETDNAARAQAAAAPKSYTIAAVAKPPVVDADWRDLAALEIGREGQPDRATVRLAHDGQWLYARFEVTDASPWRNAGGDAARLFKTGDAVDLQLGAAGPAHHDPRAGDQRVVLAQLNGQPTAVLMRPVDPGAPKELAKDYASPVGSRHFDRLEPLAAAQVTVKVEDGRYRVEARLPLAALGLNPKPGDKLRGDIGFISSDAAGLIDTARTYWSSVSTNLVNDEPLEAWLSPDAWGELVWGG